MGRRTAYAVSLVVAVLILAVGLSLAAVREGDFSSTATLLLVPKETRDPDSMSSLLDSYGRSGTSGTYVQLISSRDTLQRTGLSGVGVEVRPVPDARTIEVETTGREDVVQPAAAAVIRAAQERETELGDVWRLQVLGSPTPPEPAGLTNVQLIVATVLLAVLGALFILVILLRFRGEGPAAALGGRLGSTAPAPVGGELEQPAEVRVSFELESFRYVRASPTTVLLQAMGYWRSEHPRTLSVPTLVLQADEREHPVAPLSTPDSRPPEAGPETPLWRGSYAAPTEVLERADLIVLSAGPATAISLPHPTEQSLLAATGGGNGGAPEHDELGGAEAHVEADAEPLDEPAGDAEPRP
jgi:hypothetical protein